VATDRGDALRRLSRASGASRRELIRYQELNLITVPDGEAGEQLLRRLRRITRLRRDLGLGIEAAAVVMRLLDRFEASPPPVEASRTWVRVVGPGTGTEKR
jgi:DNA-binding transcriptional MerR regulator